MFILCVESSKGEGFLQVLLAPQTKLSGTGRSMRGKNYVNKWLQKTGSEKQKQLISFKLQINKICEILEEALSLILPVAGYQVAL